MKREKKYNREKKAIQNYRSLKQQKYQISKSEKIKYLGLGMGVLIAISYLFYDNLWLILYLSPSIYFYFPYWKEKCRKQQLEKLNSQFKEALIALTASLHAGYVIENACKEALEEVSSLYGKDSLIAAELSYMLHQMSVNQTAEEVIIELGERTKIEDIQNFASVFCIAKRSSGKISSIIDRTAKTITEKIEIQREIQTMIKGKKLEQNIMSIMPMAMIFYMRLSNSGFMDILYHSLTGKILMTICLIIYGIAIYIARKIVEIPV